MNTKHAPDCTTLQDGIEAHCDCRDSDEPSTYGGWKDEYGRPAGAHFSTSRDDIEARDSTMVEDVLHLFVAFASDMGIAPGAWPQSIATKRGNGLPFMLSRVEANRVHYTQANGCLTLMIFND